MDEAPDRQETPQVDGGRDGPEAVPAATVVLVRDRPGGPEVLMLRRNSAIAFGGMWVFPGGRIDPSDTDPAHPEDVVLAARRAAVREAEEEAGLSLDIAVMVPLSHWSPPPQAPRRFTTWFFLAPAPADAEVHIDGGEIHEHGWLRPAVALGQRDGGQIELAPPTWVTLWGLARASTVTEALRRAGSRTPRRFVTHMARGADPPIALWEGDAGYDSYDPAAPGARHRLTMHPGAWRYEPDVG